MKKNSCTPVNPKKYSCYGLKKIHTRNLITKKNSCSSKIPLPPPPHNFSNGRSLIKFPPHWGGKGFKCSWYAWGWGGEVGGGDTEASIWPIHKCTVFALSYFVFEPKFPSTSLQGAYIWRGDLTEGFLHYQFGGLIHGGAYFRNFTVFDM